ncbi:MAG TPA: ATP-binding protein [Candidatus Acidoferrales bacterium]|nr:ATP-binding protein [Candidatus Acidoferrales bacterium]
MAEPEVAVREDLLRAAFEIHQGPAQYLANALMRLRMCLALLAEEPHQAQGLLYQSLECTQAALESIKASIDRLQCPPTTVAPSIANNLCLTIDRMRSLTAAEFHVNMGDLGTVPREIAEGLAALGTEALTNAARHADANHISLTLYARNGALTLEVADDGKGFDQAALRCRRRNRTRVGLFLMRAQSRLLGGRLQIRSAPSQGTLVRVVIPLNRRRVIQ